MAVTQIKGSRAPSLSASSGYALGFDRTVVHRAVKSMAQEGLVSERKAKSGRAIHVHLTRKGNQYRERLIKARVAADENVRHQLTSDERATLVRLLKLIAELEF